MKLGLLHLAQAFVDSADSVSAAELGALTDAAIAKLKQERLGTSREFFRAVSIALRQRQRLFHVESATPLSPVRASSLTKAAEQTSSFPVHTIMTHDAELLGGVIAQVGDERFDASAVGMLRRAAEELLLPLR